MLNGSARVFPGAPPANALRGVFRDALLPFALLLLLLPTGAGAEAPGGPAGTVAQFHETLLEVMQRAEELGYQGRYRQLDPLVNDSFDIPFIARVVLGRHWQPLSEAQRAECIDLFRRSATATYAARFDGYNGEEFLEIAGETLRRGRALLRTELRRPGAEAVALDYLLHERRGKWYIISVSANGVNDLSLKRAEYAAVIKEKGYNGLVMDISAKIEEMEGASE